MDFGSEPVATPLIDHPIFAPSVTPSVIPSAVPSFEATNAPSEVPTILLSNPGFLHGHNWAEISMARHPASSQSVAISSHGARIVIGALRNDGGGFHSSHVRIYDLHGDNTWAQLDEDIDGEISGDGSGYSVAISDDGFKITIGAFLCGGNGSVRIYELQCGTTWVQMGGGINGEDKNDRFGVFIAMSAYGSRIAIGADFNDGNGSQSGHARIYELQCGNK